MMVKKSKDSVDSEDENSIPIPIQTFLWRQTSPFIRQKLAKLCESSALSFERVIVQNILHGLSPSLCEAIQSISRWKFVCASFPHVIHCCASILLKRLETNPEAKFSTSDIKLLYTLHWIILDAAGECEDNEPKKSFKTVKCSYLHSLDTIQLFVFLLIPLVSSLTRSDFDNLKLENGLRLWEPLWHYQQPNVYCFSTPVK
ncbi:hypothetical protein HELRODRAFT_77977, partial [Helobdella robusta]|uniref:Cation channel complex component UNC80 N-terminal domain-containing protein n=1 Tax=Helobdella robusta TaxID=6412 RepID=T1G359_HELRO